jgi:adhesin/invasin
MHVTVQLSSPSIVANGTSTTVVTATVTDANNTGVPGDTIAFSASDPGIQFSSPVVDNGDGTYIATLTSSTTAGSPTITATDSTASISGQTTLIQTPGPATNVSVQLAPPSIVGLDRGQRELHEHGDGDGQGRLRAPAGRSDCEISSSDRHEAISAVNDHNDGTYTATIRSSTAVGAPTITATVRSTGASAHATLNQTSANVTVTLTPSAILADGSSTSVATATVTKVSGSPLSGQTVAFSSDDPGEAIGPVSAGKGSAAGSYTATITSSTTAEAATITATIVALSPPPTGQAILLQVANPSTTTLTSVPTALVTNQQVTLIATVTSSTGVAPPTGVVAFDSGASAIGGCATAPVASTTQSATVTCQTAFSAATSAEQITAVFTPTIGSNIAGSTSPIDSMLVSRDGSSTTLQTPGGTVHVGASLMYSAAVTAKDAGPFGPTGSVDFVDGTTVIPSCAAEALTPAGTATCKLSYRLTGTHHITAVYRGDANFGGSTSSSRVVKASRPVLGTISSIMQWTFFYTPTYTKVLALVVNGAPIGGAILVQCHGRGCPFAHGTATVPKPKPCKRKSGRKCPRPHPVVVNLMARFPHFRLHRLNVGAQLTVRIVRRSWVGKYYKFVVRPRHAPRVQIACLAPGETRPGVGC